MSTQFNIFLIYWLIFLEIKWCFEIIESSSPYYISSNRFDFRNAELFCKVRCQSHLASIHSHNDYLQSLRIINSHHSILNQNKDVWIGLNDISNEGTYQNIDKAPFDYGNNTNTRGTFPWKIGSPNNANPNNGIGGQDCVQYSHSFDYLLDDTECNNLDKIMCNKCNNVINKYIIINQLKHFVDAQSFCRNAIGTNLASIHSFDDHNEAIFLCQRYDKECWIGLTFKNGIFEWTDDALFDYGNDINGGIYPWSLHEPNQQNDSMATALSGSEWNLFAPNHEKRHFLCSLPSELCFQNEWNIMNGDGWKWNQCQMENDGNSNIDEMNQMIILSEKQWINHNGVVIIEYTVLSSDNHTMLLLQLSPRL